MNAIDVSPRENGTLYRYFVDPVIRLLRQGTTPEKIALSLVVGIVLGIFPMLGMTTLLCAAAAVILRLNLPAIQLVNYIVYPLQLFLFLPFIRAGEFLFRAQPFSMTLTQILTLVRTNPLHAISVLWVATLHAIVGWLLVAPILLGLLCPPLFYLLRRAAVALNAASKKDRLAANLS